MIVGFGVLNYLVFAAYNYLFVQSTLFILKPIPETRDVFDIIFEINVTGQWK